MKNCSPLFRKGMLFVALAASGFGFTAAGDAIVVGDRMVETIHVDDAATLSGPVTQASRGRIYKTGNGTLTIDQTALANGPTHVEVLSGSVALTQSAAAPALTVPAAITEKAALWLDCSDLTSMELGDGTAPTSVGEYAARQGIARWNDRREATDPSVRDYPYVLSSNALGTVKADIGLPELFKTNGVAGIYFGGFSSGRYMDLYSKAAAQMTFDSSIAHVFFVQGFYNNWGYILGQRAGDAYWYTNGNRTPDSMQGINSWFSSVLRSAFPGSMYLNGRWIDQFTQAVPINTSVLREDFIEARCTMSALFSSKAQTLGGQTGGKGNCGGDFLHEVLVFTNVLSEAELAEIDQYLMAKWSIPQPDKIAGQRRQAVTLAEGTTLSANVAADADTLPVSLSGKGAVVKSGDGSLSVGPSGDTEFTGTVDLQAGSILSRGGRLPPVQVKGGETWSAAAYQKLNNGADRDLNGVKLTKAAGTLARTVTKTGGGEMRVNAIAADVRRIAVEKGALVFEAPTLKASVKAVTEDVTVVVTNWNFELPAEFGWFKNIGTAWTTINGWWSSTGGAFFESKHQFMDWNVPEGEHLLELTSGSTAFTRITLPAAGWYEFSFRHSARSWNKDATAAYNRNPIDICLDPASSGHAYTAYNKIATLVSGTTPFPRVTYRVKVDAAGAYVFGFRCRTGLDIDNYTYIDDIKFHYVADQDREDVWEIPNGDFEQVADGARVKTAFDYLDANGNQIATGWTLNQDASATEKTIGIARWESYGYNGGHTSFFFPGDPHFYGSAQLLMKGTLGTAQTTFTPPAGTWRLQARVARTGRNNTPALFATEPKVQATLSVGDEAVDLGQVSNTARTLAARRWPTAFTTDGVTPVTLTIQGATSDGFVIVDDFALVKDGTACDADEELIRDGGFERGANGAWTSGVEFNTSATGKYHGYGVLAYPNNVYAPTAGEGRYGFRIQQDGGAYQAVKIADAGTYRLKFIAAPRPAINYGWNSLHAWIRVKGSSVKRELGKAIIVSESWQEYSFTFDVDTPGDYEVGIFGIGYVDCADIKTYGDQHNCDHTCVIDAVSLKRVREATAATPTIDDETRPALILAAGTRLVLDYPGTMKVSSLTLDGVRVPNGVISAADYPEFLSGRGKLELAPNRGMMVIVK